MNDITSPPAVTVDRLTKRFGSRTAVDGATFDIPAGTVTGLIGPNGAGKTTLMAMLLGLVRPTSGTGTVLGAALGERADHLPDVGALIETPAFHPAVSGLANLRSLALLAGLEPSPSECRELLDLVGLGGRGDDRVGDYSLGMKQRLGIAAALLGDPSLVILDEPTNGLDPAGMHDIRRIIAEIADDRRTVIVSSHLLGELEQVCSWLVVLDHGGTVYLGPPEQLGDGADELVIAPLEHQQLDDLATIVRSAELPTRIAGADLHVRIGARHSARALAADINRRAHAAGIAVAELHVHRPDLESRYLDLVTADQGVSR